MAGTVRMADIAEKLGISIVSVSKGLAGKDGVSEEMRAKILATAQEMGYRAPSAKAKAGEVGASLGVVVADRFFNENTFYSKLYRELLNASTAAGMSVFMEIVTPQAESSCHMPRFLTDHKADGVVFMGEIDRRYLSAAAQFGLPFILLDFYDDTIAADCILSDNTSGAYQLTRQILQTGRQRIAFVGSVRATSSIMDRYLGYTKALLRAGLAPRTDWCIEDRDAAGKFIPLALPQEMPNAFVCSCDEVAYNLVETLHRAGYRVPQDVSVAGYDDFYFSTICRPPLTSYRVDIHSMAVACVDQMRRKLAHRPCTAPTVMVPGAMVLRESTMVEDCPDQK